MSRPSASDQATRMLQRLSSPDGSNISLDEVKEIQALLHHVIHLENAPKQSAFTAIPSSSFSEPQISHPQHFHGDRKNLNEFITQVSMVISTQASRFTNERAKIVYTCSYLRGSAFTWAQPLLETLDTPLENSVMSSFSQFLNRLRAAFGDPDPVITSQRELSRLKQGSSSAHQNMLPSFNAMPLVRIGIRTRCVFILRTGSITSYNANWPRVIYPLILNISSLK